MTRYALIAIVAAGGLVRFATLGSQDYWFDELFTLEVLGLDPGQILARISLTESNPPLYYLLAAGWTRLLGDGEVALRSLSALLGTAAIPVVFAAGRELVSERAGLAAAALTACSPILIWYSQEARSYSLLVLLAAVSFLCFARALRTGDVRWLLAWAISAALALSTHYLAIALIAFELAWLLWRRRGERIEVALAGAGVAVTGLALAPLAASQQGHGEWIGFVDFSERLVALPQHLVVGMAAPDGVIGPLALLVVVGASAYALARMSREARRPIALAGAAVLVGVALALIAAAAGSDYLITRNLLALWAPFAVALGALLGARAASWLGPAVLAFVCTLGLGLAVWTAATPEAGRPDWGGVVAGLGSPTEPRVVVTPPLASSIGAHLEDSRPLPPGEGVTATEFAVVELRPVSNHSIGPCFWTGFCGGRQILGGETPPIALPPGFEQVEEGTTELFRYRLYRAASPVAVPPPAGTDGAFIQEP